MYSQLLVLAACGGDGSDAGQSAQPICAAGQASGCRCADGALPGVTGCASGAAGVAATASTGASGASGSAGGAVAGGGSAGSAAAGAGGGAGAAAGAGGAAGSPLPGAGAGGAPQAGVGGDGGSGSAGMMGSAGGAAAGSDGSDDTDCGSDGTIGEASNAAGASQGRGYGNVWFQLSDGNQILNLRTTLEVPVRPNGNTTLFLWPGLEPLQGENYSPIETGVLQPVLTWGGSCAPGSPQSLSGTNWWISAQYVNTIGSHQGHTGCHGGPVMDVEIGDQLVIEMSLSGTIWNQTITSEMTGDAVDFDIDMENQPQRWAMFQIEMPTSTRPAADVVFTDTVITFAEPEPESCRTTRHGTNDYVSAPIASADGLRCCVARVVLRAQGVAATTEDPPP